MQGASLPQVLLYSMSAISLGGICGQALYQDGTLLPVAFLQCAHRCVSVRKIDMVVKKCERCRKDKDKVNAMLSTSVVVTE